MNCKLILFILFVFTLSYCIDEKGKTDREKCFEVCNNFIKEYCDSQCIDDFLKVKECLDLQCSKILSEDKINLKVCKDKCEELGGSQYIEVKECFLACDEIKKEKHN